MNVPVVDPAVNHAARRESPSQQHPWRRTIAAEVACTKTRQPKWQAITPRSRPNLDWLEEERFIEWDTGGQIVAGRFLCTHPPKRANAATTDLSRDTLCTGVVTVQKPAPPKDYNPSPYMHDDRLRIYFSVPKSLRRLLEEVETGEEIRVIFLGRSGEPNSEPQFRVEVRRGG